ncbi:hypothetical protein [Fodinicola acaciae]|uniref:hypothetical protein n=1 Tax=Fodinicola acaciae TaxID=2681555 RepID=UPI0013D0BAD4|nr:hypothetical protein [Fodinicola acaciae]
MGENSVSMTKKSSKLSRFVTRRAVATATAGLLGAGALLLGAAPAQAADADATVNGSCLIVVACDLSFSQPTFTVPSGGDLTVKNNAGGLLNGPVTVSIGDQKKTISPGKTVTFSFGQSSEQQSYTMNAASGLVNVTTKSTVTVTPKAKPSDSPTPEPSKPGGGSSTPGGGSSSGGGVQAPSLPNGAVPNHGQPPALLPPGLTNTPNSQHNQNADPGLPAGVNDGTGTPSQAGTAPGNTQSDPTAVGRPNSDAPGPLTLLVLVASVVIAGVGSAAVRTVLRGRKLARVATH